MRSRPRILRTGLFFFLLLTAIVVILAVNAALVEKIHYDEFKWMTGSYYLIGLPASVSLLASCAALLTNEFESFVDLTSEVRSTISGISAGILTAITLGIIYYAGYVDIPYDHALIVMGVFLFIMPVTFALQMIRFDFRERRGI